MDEGPLDDLWAFDTQSKTWTCVMEHTEEKGGPSKRSFHQMVTKGGKEGGREGRKGWSERLAKPVKRSTTRDPD